MEESYKCEYDKDRLRKFIIKAIKKRDDLDELEPKFYAVSGSHIYGFDDEDSDIDLRGFHLADGSKYSLLSEPSHQLTINQGGQTQGFKNYPKVEMCSYELKKFGKLIYGMNFNVLEWLFHGDVVINSVDLELDVLRNIIKDHLPANVPYAYRGMAKNNYHKYLNSNKDSYRPNAKKFLYVIRGLLGAIHVYENEEIEPRVTKLAREHLASDFYGTVIDLIKFKRYSDKDFVGTHLRRMSHGLIDALFKGLGFNIDVSEQKKGLRDEIDDWMMKVRR